MSETAEGFQEHWAAYLARRMEERIGAALAAPGLDGRRDILSEALEMGKEALLRIQSGPTGDAAERAGLIHLEQALDEVQGALNAFDPCYDPPIQDAREHAARAAEEVSRSGGAGSE